METPTVSKKQAKSTLSGKKKKTEVIKNVLMKPYQNYWPLLSSEDNCQLKDTLNEFLPKIVSSKVNIPYEQIKSIPKDERKKYRRSLQNLNERNEADSKNLFFGVNDVAKLLEDQEAGAVLVASDVQPRLFVQHILDQAVLYKVPVLVMNGLRTVCKDNCGITGAVVALKKTLPSESKLGIIQQTIRNIYDNYPVPKHHINYSRKLDVTTVTIPDSEDGRSVCSSSDSDEIIEQINYYLTRQSHEQRVFVPEQPDESRTRTYVALGSSVYSNSNPPLVNSEKADYTEVDYRPLVVKRIKGNKNRQKHKLQKVKKKTRKLK